MDGRTDRHPYPASSCPRHQPLPMTPTAVFLCANQTESPLSLAQDPNVSHMWAWLAIVHKMHEQINEEVYEQPLLALFQPGYSVCNRNPRETSK